MTLKISLMLPLIDKANEKITFICQQFCAFALMKEMGLDYNNTGTNIIYKFILQYIKLIVIKLSLVILHF